MTCIVGVNYKGKVYIGADSGAVCADLSITVREDAKVFIKDDFLIGFTTSFRMGQLLRYSLDTSIIDKCEDPMEFLTTAFINNVRDCFLKGGFLIEKDKQHEGGTFLVGYKGSLYCVYSDFQVAKSHKIFSAVGCGSKYALGAVEMAWRSHTILDDLKVEETILNALSVAAAHNVGVSAPFTVLSI